LDAANPALAWAMVAADLHVRVVADDGTVLRELTLDPTRDPAADLSVR